MTLNILFTHIIRHLTMISRKDKLLNLPWEQRRYEQHREKVKAAKATIDRSPPTYFPHIIQKAKKHQMEKERNHLIEKENVRLLQSLGDVMRTKQMQDFWKEPRPNFLGRQKLFDKRPKTAPVNWSPMEGLKKPVSATPIIRSTRCPTCCGHPERPKLCIPEERIPWQPSRTSFNVRFFTKRFLSK